LQKKIPTGRLAPFHCNSGSSKFGTIIESGGGKKRVGAVARNPLRYTSTSKYNMGQKSATNTTQQKQKEVLYDPYNKTPGYQTETRPKQCTAKGES
jgi:hypothetical protein